MTTRFNHFINGECVAPSENDYLESTTPATLDVLYEFARGIEKDVDRAVNAADDAFRNPAWAGLTQTQRGHLLRKLGDAIGENTDELARLESLDNDKLLREMKASSKTYRSTCTTMAVLPIRLKVRRSQRTPSTLLTSPSVNRSVSSVRLRRGTLR